MAGGCRAQLSIDLEALRHNFQQVRQAAPASKIMAAVKANGYGHGMVKVAQALTEADAFAVATVAEALTLKRAKISQPIVILEGFLDLEELNLAVEEGFICVIHSPYQLELMENKLQGELKVWVKIDSGMHRLGFPLSRVESVNSRLAKMENVELIGWMSHFSDADDLNNPKTDRQIDDFSRATAGLKGERSLANSGGILGWPDSHLDWVRPGIMLYGSSPFANKSAEELGLRPVMHFTAKIITVNRCQQGDSVGYGSSWQCPEDMAVGVVSVGYGDGYPRHAAFGTPLLVNGGEYPLIGRVSMDMVTIDLRSNPDLKTGDEVVLWGGGLPVDRIAASATTISYELFCGVTQRVVRK
ncbi:MAG: alanine racemase [Gammaproteobacteria bacterium]|nr:alanine racemase [Gammaproteobacteria bacterium]